MLHVHVHVHRGSNVTGEVGLLNELLLTCSEKDEMDLIWFDWEMPSWNLDDLSCHNGSLSGRNQDYNSLITRTNYAKEVGSLVWYPSTGLRQTKQAFPVDLSFLVESCHLKGHTAFAKLNPANLRLLSLQQSSADAMQSVRQTTQVTWTFKQCGLKW